MKYAAPLAVASAMLDGAASSELTATTVVGVLGADDTDAFRSVVARIAEEHGLEAQVRLHPGAYSVRFSR